MTIPRDRDDATVAVGRKRVALTNLGKVFFPEIGATKGRLLQYYADVAGVLLPHIAGRAMVMKRYPNGAAGEFFFMKRVPQPHPPWLRTCPIEHGSGSVIDFPVIDDPAALLWMVNLGCIDLNPWYARCDDVDRPDYAHFDLDPGESSFAMVREVALLVRDGLQALGMPAYAKTTGSKGMHVYVPIVRGPTQKQVWTFAKAFAVALSHHTPELTTVAYHKDRRPKDRVLIDYNQNRWGATLASVYSVRPTPRATVSAPVSWDEVEAGIDIADFHIGNMPARIAKVGDLWKPLAAKRGRFDLTPLVD
ncbi:MAG TPA: non-homologous end-joining DNA ligase [Candidatus Baltobacteraceae bacterium]|nr:non-homologous end-joining DNA ligase [Candidatus Baltobacteraceae bacterium]HTX56992.1 non-homologous end-joining DNA ligase [Candidatus Acidoferrales bacterium]